MLNKNTCSKCKNEIDSMITYYSTGYGAVCEDCMTNMYGTRLILSPHKNGYLYNHSINMIEPYGLTVGALINSCGWFIEKKIHNTKEYKDIEPNEPLIQYYLKFVNKKTKCRRVNEDNYFYAATTHCSGNICLFSKVKEAYQMAFEGMGYD